MGQGMARIEMSAGALLIRFCVSYVIGTTIAAGIMSLGGGSTSLLILYSVAFGAPYFGAVTALAILFRRSVVSHPIRWIIGLPPATAVIWFVIGEEAAALFDPIKLAIYATLCAILCGAVFLIMNRLTPHVKR